MELAFTRHGPVLKLDPEAGRAFALRSVWFEPGTSSYFAAARYQSAGDWPTFKQALAHWGAAAMNFVYADVDGNIAWIPTGLMPKRPNWDGLMPVPGDGRYEWQGFRTQDELPCIHNPARGWVGSANEMNLAPDYPARSEIGFEWADPCRMDRIDEVLGASERITVDECLALQTDVFCGNALRAAALLRGLKSDDAMVDSALRLLEAWDGHEPLDSAAAAIAEVWLNKHLGPHLAARITTPDAAKLIAFGQPYALSTYLQDPAADLGEPHGDPAAARESLLLASLKSALDEIAERLGPNMPAWRWGDLHHARFVPPAAMLADDDLRARMIHGPAPIPGSAFTVRAATYRMDDFAAINGASFRMVVDVGDWDNSRIINSPGQSGDPASPHYDDLFPLWAEGRYVPMLWTRSAIEAAASQVIVLTPEG